MGFGYCSFVVCNKKPSSDFSPLKSPLLCDSALRRLHALKNTPRGREHIQMARPREKLGITFHGCESDEAPKTPPVFLLGFFMLKKNTVRWFFTCVFFLYKRSRPFLGGSQGEGVTNQITMIYFQFSKGVKEQELQNETDLSFLQEGFSHSFMKHLGLPFEMMV